MNATRTPIIREKPVKTVTASGRPGKAGNLPKELQPRPIMRQAMPHMTAAPVRSKAEKFAVDFFRTEKRLQLEDEHQEAIIKQTGGIVPPTLSVVRKVYVTNMPSQVSLAPSGVSATAANMPPPQDGDRGRKKRPPPAGSFPPYKRPPGGGGGGALGGGMPGRFPAANVVGKKGGKGADVVSRNPVSGIITITDTQNLQDIVESSTTASTGGNLTLQQPPSPKFVRPLPFGPTGSSRVDIPTPLTANSELARSRAQPNYRGKKPGGLSVITSGIGPESGYNIQVSTGAPTLTGSTPSSTGTAIYVGPAGVRSPKGKGPANTPSPLPGSSASPADYGDPTWTWNRRAAVPHAAAEANALYGPPITGKSAARASPAPKTAMDGLPQAGGPAKGTPQMVATQAGNARALPLGPGTAVKRNLMNGLRKDVNARSKRGRMDSAPLSPSPYLPLGAGTAQKRPAEKLRGMEAVRGKKAARLDPSPLSPSPYLPLGPATGGKRAAVYPDTQRKKAKSAPILPTVATRPAGTFAGVVIPQRRTRVAAAVPVAPAPTAARRPAGTFAGVVIPKTRNGRKKK
ncbi:hypothetical protein HK097_005366 [Rhizophlyctis rosea]|uniref:Uncharacterized protein n=1 Tax=Rhizophlyctis rosea TaxID=64517 RepID=A0AAD5WWX0_9FUNG|nr:hypothetical protein HK097_005366 [Rhizophlyctis rosea]